MSFCAVMAIFCNYQYITYLSFGFTTVLIEANSSTNFILLSQGQNLASIIIVSYSIYSSLPYWVHASSSFTL